MPYRMSALLALTVAAGVIASTSVMASTHDEYRHEIRNDMNRCAADRGPAIMVTVDGIRQASGTMRVQTYRANAAEWMAKGKWLTRIEVPARAGSMTFCVPVNAAGTYGVAIRHDVNGNGSTDLRTDGGAISNNPSISIFNLGKPSYTKVGVPVTTGVRSIRVQMKYM